MARLARWTVALLAAAAALAAACTAADPIVLQNKAVQVAFAQHPTGYGVQSLRALPSGADLLVADEAALFKAAPLWELHAVLDVGQPVQYLRSNAVPEGTVLSHELDGKGTSLVLHYDHWAIERTAFNVSVTITVPSDDSTFVSLSLSVENLDPSARVGLWWVSVALPGVKADGDDATAFYPRGYGVEYAKPLASLPASLGGGYPGSSCTMQFLAAGPGGGVPGAYFAAADPGARAKSMVIAKQTATSGGEPPTDRPLTPHIPLDVSRDVPGANSHPPTHSGAPWPQAAVGRRLGPDADGFLVLSMTMTVAGAGQAFSSYSLPFEVQIGVAAPRTAQEPLWYAAAMLYRAWALASAPWTKAGKITERVPAWYANNDLWFNSGWQCKDIFNVTQGDPAVVKERLTHIQERFNTSLLLHWYEWQQGPNPDPATRYRFDTHYPDYVPARKGMEATVEALAHIGVRTFPYINGRIFDIGSESYLKEDGGLYCCKQERTPAFGNQPLFLNNETYGSGSTFHVADPSLAYWKDKYVATVKALADQYGVQGVYLDQLAAGSPDLDWDPTHNHSVGGGTWWVDGLNAFIKACQQAGSAPSVMVTESNAEPYMGAIQGYLTLVAFDPPFAPGAGYQLAAAFPAIYGGLFVGFGDIYAVSDFVDPDVLCSRLAVTFVSGTQLGWMSLGGVTHGPDVDSRCGPQGVYDLLMSSEQEAQVDFIKELLAYRALLRPYFLEGQLAVPFALTDNPAFMATAKPLPRNPGPLPSVASAAWVHEGRVLLVLVGATPTARSQHLALDMALYGVTAARVTATQLLANGTTKPLGEFAAHAVALGVLVPARGVVAIEVRAAQE